MPSVSLTLSLSDPLCQFLNISILIMPELIGSIERFFKEGNLFNETLFFFLMLLVAIQKLPNLLDVIIDQAFLLLLSY
jgi:hypothetical protein